MKAATKRRKQTRHPWGKWFGANRIWLYKGIDYACPTGSLLQQIRNAASRRKFKVSLREGDDWIRITVTSRPPTAKVA